jgi:glutathione synthase/RimK-type ligase-like ATP-grasp enzyme
MHDKTRRLALATCSAQPELYAEERDIIPMLRAHGVLAEPAVWNDPSVDWGSFDAVVVRSTWDYFQHAPEFFAWLDRLERAKVRLHNSTSLVRWNADKLYLADLARRGVRIVPTVFCEKGTRAPLADVLASKGWEQAVIKPSVSGGAFRTQRVEARDLGDAQSAMDEILASCSALVQPFFPEIATEGEWSLFFFAEELSHAVLKTPTPSDYRIQPQFGGTFARVDPEPSLLEQARAVLAALPERPAYARIDGLRRGKDFYLMEAELIEPYLFLAGTKDAMERYVRLLEKLASGG